MPATAVETWDERWAMPEGRADWHVTTPSKLVVCRPFRLTRRWREADSNHRSRSCERLIWGLPIGDGGTKGGATYRFRPETAMLAWSGSP